MSQVEFGKSLNVTKQTVSNWENNNVQPSVDILKSIAIEYGVSTCLLYTSQFECHKDFHDN